MKTAFSLSLLLSALVAFTVAAPPNIQLLDPTLKVVPFVTDFPYAGFSIGPIGITFDNTHAYIGNYFTGCIGKYPINVIPQTAATAVLSQCYNVPALAGLAYAPDGHLYAAVQGIAGRVLRINPATLQLDPSLPGGALQYQLGALLPDSPTGLAYNKKTGQLVLSNGGGGADPAMYVISNPAGASSTVTPRDIKDGNGNKVIKIDGIYFDSDGLLYAAHAENTASYVYKEDYDNPAGVQFLARYGPIPFVDGVALLQDKYLVGNSNDGRIYKADITLANPVITVVSNSTISTSGTLPAGTAQRGDFAAVGPDGCLYATQTDGVVKVTNADGSCSFSPPFSNSDSPCSLDGVNCTPVSAKTTCVTARGTTAGRCLTLRFSDQATGCGN